MNLENIDVSLNKLTLLITKRCNLWCRTCDYRATRNKYSEINLDQITQLISDAHELGLKQLVLTGGEPMLRKEIYDILDYASSLNVHNTVISNGTLIGEAEVDKLLKSGLNDISISLDCFQEINDQIRGEGSYQKALDALKSFCKYRDSMGSITVGITISKANYRYIFDFCRFLFEEIGVKSITFNPFNKYMLHPAKHRLIGDFEITDDLIPGLELELDKIIAYSKVGKGTFWQNERYFKKIPHYFAGKSMVPSISCTEPLMGCVIEANGLVYPCIVEYVVAGDINVSSIKDIVRSEEYRSVCLRALRNKCRGCLNACYNNIHSIEECSL